MRWLIAVALLAAACGGKKKSGGDYVHKAKAAEAQLNLNKLYKGAQVYFQENGQFPIGSVPATPALGTCCAGPNHRCPPELALWSDPTWTALQFEVEDPHYFSYEYESDGKSFTARAKGDLDCDQVYSTYSVTGGPGEAPGIQAENEGE